MKALEVKAEALARAAQRRRIAALARTWRERLPEATVETTGSEVSISARRLRKRWLEDSSLRFLGRGER